MNFIQWRSKLGLEEEGFILVKEKDFPGVCLNYDKEKELWRIRYDGERWGGFHLIHKLGFIWLWKKWGVLDSIKTNYFSNHLKPEVRTYVDTIMDAIAYFALAEMDRDFRTKLVDYELNNLLRVWKGSIRFPPNTSFIDKIGLYTYTYLKYSYFFPKAIGNIYLDKMTSVLDNIKKLIIKSTPSMEKMFIDLHTHLGKFDTIKESESYEDILDYSNHLFEIVN